MNSTDVLKHLVEGGFIQKSVNSNYVLTLPDKTQQQVSAHLLDEMEDRQFVVEGTDRKYRATPTGVQQTLGSPI